MRVLITGSSKGIGRATALKFLKEGHEVFGIDLLESTIDDKKYHHYVADVSLANSLPNIREVEILFVNAGKQNSGSDITNNLVGSINTIEKYGFNDKIKSILINVSASARSGQEFPEYVASKSGLVGYMRNVAIRLAPLGATCNALSLGGVNTESNKPVMEDKKLWSKIMNVTPLKKWADEDEVADWVYFLTVINKSMSGEDILVDNGEQKLNPTFIWPK